MYLLAFHHLDRSHQHLTMLDDKLRGALTGLDAAAALPPIATHLNADSSWLLLIPIPAAAVLSTRRRRYFSIVIDPWLVGPQADVTRFLSQQTHAIKSAYSSLEEVEKFVEEVEELVAGSGEFKAEEAGYIDLVVVSAEFTDHLHIETLKEIRKSVPILAGGQVRSVTVPPESPSLIFNIYSESNHYHQSSCPLRHCLGTTPTYRFARGGKLRSITCAALLPFDHQSSISLRCSILPFRSSHQLPLFLLKTSINNLHSTRSFSHLPS